MPQYRPEGAKIAKCPYYITDSAKSISCVGWCCDIVQKLEFSDPEDKSDWLRTHCVKPEGKESCPRAKDLKRR